MGDNTGIEWADATWNPTTGCDRVTPGCDHCYALTTAKRMKAMGVEAYQKDGREDTSGPGFGLTMHPSRLDQPLRWTRPRKVFVNSMSDLFHAQVDVGFIAEVWAVMALAQQHTFQVLTKRHARLRSVLSSPAFRDAVQTAMTARDPGAVLTYPLPNVWVGVSVEDQERATLRIPALLQTPAAVRFLSMEPLLGPVNIAPWLDPERDCNCWVPALDGAGQHAERCACHGQPEVHWVIVGGESGKDARPMHPDWARMIRDDCARAGVAFLFKQWGEWAPGVHDYGTRSGPVGRAWCGDTPNGTYESMTRVGKKAAGRVLDGQTHDGYPR